MPLCRHSHNGARNHCRDGSSVKAVAYRWKATGHNAPSFVRVPRLRGGMAGLDHETLNSDPLYSDRAMERAASAKSMRRVRWARCNLREQTDGFTVNCGANVGPDSVLTANHFIHR